MSTTDTVEENYKRFCKLDGSEYIATGFALSIIIKLIERFNVNSVLELGLGIGAIADTVLKFSEQHKWNLKYVGTEENEFCNNALKENIQYYSKLEHHSKLSELDLNNSFDLIIIDGLDDNLQQIKSYCKKRSIIFIEGDRTPQANFIMSIFPKARHVNVITLEKNKSYSHGNPDFFIGGGRIIFINPDSKMTLFYWQARISTYIKRILRNFL